MHARGVGQYHKLRKTSGGISCDHVNSIGSQHIFIRLICKFAPISILATGCCSDYEITDHTCASTHAACSEKAARPTAPLLAVIGSPMNATVARG
jgi:hypothetical protein